MIYRNHPFCFLLIILEKFGVYTVLACTFQECLPEDKPRQISGLGLPGAH